MLKVNFISFFLPQIIYYVAFGYSIKSIYTYTVKAACVRLSKVRWLLFVGDILHRYSFMLIHILTLIYIKDFFFGFCYKYQLMIQTQLQPVTV